MVKTASEIEIIHSAGKIVAKVLRELSAAAEEGITLKDLDGLAYGLIKKAGAEPSFLGYQPDGATRPYPSTICTSLNDVVVHGIPTKRRLKNGDLLKIDLGVKFAGFHADAAISIGVGEISPTAQKLIEATKQALYAAIAAARAGNTLGDIGYAVKKTALDCGFKVAENLTGHGIGRELHEEPTVFNEGRPGKGLKLRSGMVLAVEPMFSAGSPQTIQLADESYATADKSLSAHFEHTIAITEKGAEVLTMI